MTGRVNHWLALPAIALLLSASAFLQAFRDRTFATAAPAEELLYVRSPEVVQRFALSFRAIAADVYWMRALQHFGQTRQRAEKARRFELLFPLLDMATTLDPYFNIAYRFGAIFLSEVPPGGPGQPELAIRLLQKGLAASPQKWQYKQDIGFVEYWARHDYEAAAKWFDEASRMPGAPWFLKSLAAVTLVQGGERGASRLLFQTIAVSGENDWMRRDAQRRLRQLDTMDEMDRMRAVLQTYRQRGGAPPFSWEQLIRLGYLRRLPLDADGVPLQLGPWSGDVTLADDSALAPLPDEPPRQPGTAAP